MRRMLANSAVIASAIAAVLLAVDHNTNVFAPAGEEARAQDRERCYGIAKAGTNDCGNAVHACAGRAVADGLPFEWKMVPTGTCEKMHGGRLKSSDETQS